MEERESGWYAAAAICVAGGGACLYNGMVVPGACLMLAAVVTMAVGLHRWARACSAACAALKAREQTIASLEQAAADTEVRNREEMAAVEHAARDKIARFCSEISHELRLPISIIAGYSDLLYKDIVTEESVRKEYLSKISERIAYLNDILSRRLTAVRDGQLAERLQKSEFDVLALLREITQDVSAAALDRAIELRVISAEREMFIFADPTHLTRAFYNIIENAFKYMGRSGTINITVARIAGDQVQIIFQDDGLGLPDEETAHIFELNYQGSNREEGHGRGHGLYLVRMSVLSHGGTIVARSARGRGMGIYITLPIRSEKA